jgi:hypothetical protein
MGQAPVPPFNAAAFKAALMKRIADLAPKNLEQASDFKKGNKLGAVKDDMAGQVKEGKAASERPLAEKTREAPSTSGIEAKPVTDLPPANAGRPPAGIGAERAVPKPRPPAAIELPIRQESQSIDQQMAEAQVTDRQLERSNEPEFQGALKSKKEAQARAESDPKAFRLSEQKQLARAEGEAVTVAQRQLQAMHGERGKALNLVVGRQTQAQSRDEQARAKVAADIQNIYLAAKAKVEAILNALDGKVERAFDAGAATAKKVFEDYVERRMDEYKEDRYSGVRGKLRWVRDKFAGLPSEVNRFYEEGRALYLAEMDRAIDKVIAIIGAELTAAKAAIQKGQDDIAGYVAKLPRELADVGRETMEDVQGKFTQLEESVNSKQETLIDTLAQKYQQNLQAVDERIKELKEANKGLIAKAVGFVKGVIETIRKLGKLLRTVLSRIADVVGLILQDPIGFFGNLIAGLKLGFNNFVANIEKHLIAGLLTWLTGTLGPLNIKMPDDVFSLKGIFSLVMQVLGLTWEYMRAKAVGMFGETVVAGMEKAAEIFLRLKEGPAAVWEYIKEQFDDLKETVLGQIKEMVITEVIKAGVKWLLSLLNPVAALIKAAMAIYNIVMFIVDRAAQIADFILALMDAIADIARGIIGGAAAKVENALAKSIPLIIGFLASLLGITGLVTKVQKLIQRIRGRIDNAITKLLIKAKSLVVRVTQAGVAGVKTVAQKIFQWWRARKSFTDDAGQEHAVYFQGEDRSASLTVASTPRPILVFLASVRRKTEQAGNERYKPFYDSAIYIVGQINTLTDDLKSSPKEDPQKEAKYARLNEKIGLLIGKPLKVLLVLESTSLAEGQTEYDAQSAHTFVMSRMSDSNKRLLQGHGRFISGHAGRGFSIATRDAVDNIGYADGDHSFPDIKVPGTGSPMKGTQSHALGRGNWVPDHQPPDELLAGGATVTFRFYPHSQSSARAQGGAVRVYKMWMKQRRSKGDGDWAQGVRSEWFW